MPELSMVSTGFDPVQAQNAGAATGAPVILRLGDPERHFWLVRSVARVMDLSLGAVVARGHLDRDGYRALVNRCRTCDLVAGCESWLAGGAEEGETSPPGCLVAPELERLKRLMDDKGAR